MGELQGTELTIRLNDIYCAVQGEGHQAGLPMVLIRLQGCGVGCPWCDTKETWIADPSKRVDSLQGAMGTNSRWCDAEPVEIASRARQAGENLRWALVTGGEPAEQDLEPLCDALHAEGFRVAVETSGTSPIGNPHVIDWICVSPKFNMPGGKSVIPGVLAMAHEIKMVIAGAADLNVLDTALTGLTLRVDVVISLQPVSQQSKATRLCLETCLDRGWSLSLQLHKFIHAR